MKILVNNEIQAGQWKDLISGCRHSSPFQTMDFFLAVSSLRAMSAEAVAAEEDGKLLALVVVTIQREPGLAGFFSSRAIIFGGPLVRDGYSEALGMVLQHISKSIKRRVIYAETRNLSDYGLYKDSFWEFGWSYIPYLNFCLRTDDSNAMLDRVSESRLRQVRKAKKAGVTWKEAEDITEVEHFFGLLTVLYKKVGKPLLPWEFFKVFFEKNLGKYLLVYFGDKIIGGIVCPVLERTTIYEMYVCGLDEEYRDKYPSIMATWAAIEYASASGIKVFDFMGAGKPGEDYGVRDFKARFGGEMVEYGRFRKIFRPLLFFIGSTVINLRSGKKK